MASTIPAAATGPKATSTHRAFIRALLLAQSPEGYMSLCRTIASAKCPRYGDIRCPLLIVAGSHDQTSPLRGSRDILSRSLIALDAVSVAAANTPQMGG